VVFFGTFWENRVFRLADKPFVLNIRKLRRCRGMNALLSWKKKWGQTFSTSHCIKSSRKSIDISLKWRQNTKQQNLLKAWPGWQKALQKHNQKIKNKTANYISKMWTNSLLKPKFLRPDKVFREVKIWLSEGDLIFFPLLFFAG